MSDISIEISIPLDDEGFIEMECDYCKNRFMLTEKTYKDEDNVNFFCPICGLANRIDTFFVPEVSELVRQKAVNYAMEEIGNTLRKSFRQINKNGFIKMSMQKYHGEPEKEIYKPLNRYVKCYKKCCNLEVKVLYFDKETGIYCPVCGGGIG